MSDERWNQFKKEIAALPAGWAPFMEGHKRRHYYRAGSHLSLCRFHQHYKADREDVERVEMACGECVRRIQKLR